MRQSIGRSGSLTVVNAHTRAIRLGGGRCAVRAGAMASMSHHDVRHQCLHVVVLAVHLPAQCKTAAASCACGWQKSSTCRLGGSNTRPFDLQSNALPTELSRRCFLLTVADFRVFMSARGSYSRSGTIHLAKVAKSSRRLWLGGSCLGLPPCLVHEQLAAYHPMIAAARLAEQPAETRGHWRIAADHDLRSSLLFAVLREAPDVGSRSNPYQAPRWPSPGPRRSVDHV